VYIQRELKRVNGKFAALSGEEQDATQDTFSRLDILSYIKAPWLGTDTLELQYIIASKNE